MHALNRYDDAIKLYDELLSQKSNARLEQNLVSALISKGDYLLTKSKFKESIEPFERAISLDLNQSYAYYGLAKAYECLKNADLAMVNYEKALEIEPDKELYKKDFELFKTEQITTLPLLNEERPVAIDEPKVETETKTVVTIKPVSASDFNSSNTNDTANVNANSTQKSAGAEELTNLDNLMINKPSASIEDNIKALTKEADDLYKSGQNTSAIEKYLEVLKLSPNDYFTAFKVGNLYKIENNPDKAITYYKKAVSINKNYSDAWFNLGLVYASNGDFKNCRDCFNKVIALSPDYAYAYYALAMSFEKEGNNEKAIENYQKYYDLENDDLTKRAIVKRINELKAVSEQN